MMAFTTSATNLVNDTSSSVTGSSTENIAIDPVTRPMEVGVMGPLDGPNVTQVFTVNCTSLNRQFESEEELITANMKWKFCGSNNYDYYFMSLKRIHMHNIYPKCTLKCQIKIYCGICQCEMFLPLRYVRYEGRIPKEISFVLPSNISTVPLGCFSKRSNGWKAHKMCLLEFNNYIFEFTIISID